MTELEAIKGLSNLFSEHELTLPCTDSLEILHMAVAALEKQIPKKPIKQHEEPTDEEAKELVDLGFCGGDVIRCPNCNEYIVVNELKHCMECGQTLDWSK